MFLGSFMFIAACVTINVYFPAAEVESAAEKIVKDVLSDDQADSGSNDQSGFIFNDEANHIAQSINPLNWFFPAAHAQVDITLSSPAISELTAKLKDRFNNSLKAHLNNNVIGFSNDGLVEIVDASGLGLKDRQALKKVVADENRDRLALYREMAIANNHPEWEEQITDAFVKQWIAQAKSGWSYQNANNDWVKKQ